MLSNLLPGLRQLRTPLAIGYLWLVNLWLLFADDIPPKTSGGLVGNVYELAGFLGSATVLAAITFSAYIIGSISLVTASSSLAVNQFRRFLLPLPYQILPSSFLVTLSDFWERKGKSKTAIDWSEKRGWDEMKKLNSNIRLTVRDLIIQRNDLRIKLLMADNELYSEYDRLESEADFRLNTSFPLTGLFCILAYEANLLWLIGLAPVALLFWRGATRAYNAVTVLIRAILVGKIEGSGDLAITSTTTRAVVRRRFSARPRNGMRPPAWRRHSRTAVLILMPWAPDGQTASGPGHGRRGMSGSGAKAP